MTDIFVDDQGEGHAFVFVHGFLGSSEMWSFQKNYFKKKYRIIAPALPGFGESYKAKSLSSINEMAKFILKIVNQKKIDKFHLIGHSMGGMIVQEIVKIEPDKVQKLICFATSSIGDIPGRFEPMNVSIQRLKTDGIDDFKNRIPPKWFVKGNKDKNYYFCKNAAKNVSEETANNAMVAMKNWNGYSNLKNINNKTLIIWGDKDVSYNFKQVDTLNKNIPKSELKIVKESSHNTHLEKPEEVNKIIEQFLN
jgi:2-hydroxy-6-oxonona-2,4-dienedioate hydrolase